jgi:hypothetical protein
MPSQLGVFPHPYASAGQGNGSHSPHTRAASFPEHSSTGPPQPYFPPSSTTPSLTEGTRRHIRRSYGFPPPTASSSESRQFYRAERSDASSSIFSQSGGQPHSGGGYTATDAQLEHQDWNAAGHDEHDYGPRGPPGNLPVFAHSSK